MASSVDMSAKAEEIARVLSEPVVDLWRLRELALSEGGLVNDSLRKLAWPKLVGLNPTIMSPNTSSSSLQNAATPSTATPSTPIPPSLDSEQIERDVSRVTWHLLTGNQRQRNFQMKNKSDNKRIASLLKRKQRRLGDFLNLTLVMSYGEIDIEEKDEGRIEKLRYYQGYHDIASIILSALGGATSVQTTLPTNTNLPQSNSSIQQAHTAASTTGLTLACQVLLQLSTSHLRDALKSNFVQLNAALRLILLPLTAAFDSQVHSHLYDCEMEPFFALSWILTWFSHDVRDTSLVKRLFDFFIVSHPLMCVYMSVAMIIHPLNRIEILATDCDFACVHHVLADLPKNSSNVGWKYVPGDGGYGYVSGEEDSASANGSWMEGSCDDEEGSQISSCVNGKGCRVPFQELIDLSIELMQKIPPRNLINLAQRYHTSITLSPLMAEASSISLLQPPPSRCLASHVDSDWVLKQKLREEHGLKLNRHQRKKRFKLVNTDVEYHGYDDDDGKSKILKKRHVSKAVIASGTGPDGRAEERRVRKRRKMLVRSVAVVLLSVFAALAKDYFMPLGGDGILLVPKEVGKVALEESVSVSSAASDDKTCKEDTCTNDEKPSDILPDTKSGANNVADEPIAEQSKECASENAKKEPESTIIARSGDAEQKSEKKEIEEADRLESAVEKPHETAKSKSAVEKPQEMVTPESVEKPQVSVTPGNTEKKPEKTAMNTKKVNNCADDEETKTDISTVIQGTNIPSSSLAPLSHLSEPLLTLFYSIERHLELFLSRAINFFQLKWLRTEIAPVAQKLITELDDESTGWENVARETWNKRVDMYRNQWKRVSKFTSDMIQKSAKKCARSGRDLSVGVVKGFNKKMKKKLLKQDV